MIDTSGSDVHGHVSVMIMPACSQNKAGIGLACLHRN